MSAAIIPSSPRVLHSTTPIPAATYTCQVSHGNTLIPILNDALVSSNATSPRRFLMEPNEAEIAMPTSQKTPLADGEKSDILLTQTQCSPKQSLPDDDAPSCRSSLTHSDASGTSYFPLKSPHRTRASLSIVSKAEKQHMGQENSIHRRNTPMHASSSDLLIVMKRMSTNMTGRHPSMHDTKDSSEDEAYMCIPGSSNTLLNAWSCVIIACALYDAVTVPYRWAFWIQPRIEITPFVISFIVLDAISDLCYIANVYVTLRTALVENGLYITDRAAVRKSYTRSAWFVLDILAIAPLDLIQIVYDAVLPWTRALKILRLLNVVHLIQGLEESRTVSFLFRLSKLIFYTLMLSHYAACIKYHTLLGSIDPIITFISNLGSDFSRYLQVFYWALGSVTGRDDTSPPESFADTSFTVCMMLVGILWFAYIIASMEQFTESASTANSRLQAKLKYVSDFMYAFHLPPELQARVKSYYSYLFSSIVKYEDEMLLSKLPSALRTDLRLAYASQVLEKAEIFANVDPGFLAQIVHYFTIVVTIPGERICSLNEQSHAIYFIQDGEVEILIGPKLAQIATLRNGDYFGEYGLIQPSNNRVRTSTARSTTYCTLFMLRYNHMELAMDTFPSSRQAILTRVAEQRKRTIQQEQNLNGLGGESIGKKSNKLQKLIQVEETNINLGRDAVTINPNGRYYQKWVWLTIMITLYNALVLPFRLGFLPNLVSIPLLLFDYIGDVLFWVDIFMCFRVQYLDKGEVIKDLDLIRRRYLTSWFGLYVLASLPLDFAMVAEGMNPLWRMNRLLRLVDLHFKILVRMRESNRWELLSLSYLMAVFVFLSHFAACIYFSFTRFEGFAESFGQWLPPTQLESNNASMFYQYVFSQYYSMTLLAGIGRHVYPPSNYDVILTVSLMLIGVFVVSYLIGKVGHLIFQLDATANKFKSEYNYIQSMFEYRKVDIAIQTRVNEYMKHVWSSQRGIDPNIALADLPSLLRTEIMMFICENLIRSVPRFKNLDEPFIRALVSELRFIELPQGEWVFRQGQLGDSMYFVSNGLVDIIFDVQPLGPIAIPASISPSTSATNLNTAAKATEAIKFKVIGAGSFFGEGALLHDSNNDAPPTRTASMRTHTKCQLLALDKDSFEKVMSAHPRFAHKIHQLNKDRRHKLHSLATLTAATGLQLGGGRGTIMSINQPNLRSSFNGINNAIYNSKHASKMSSIAQTSKEALASGQPWSTLVAPPPHRTSSNNALLHSMEEDDESDSDSDIKENDNATCERLISGALPGEVDDSKNGSRSRFI